MAHRMFARLLSLALAALAAVSALGTITAAPLLAWQPAPQGDFVPFTGVPPDQQMPAAPLVIGAYAFFLLLMMFYLWTIWRRIGKVEADMRALERRQVGRSPGT
jgi:hypothetical protein